MAAHYGRADDLIRLEIRPDHAGPHWRHRHRFNLTGDSSIPFATYAKFVVDTAPSLGQGGDKGFFKTQSQTHLARALELLRELQRAVTLAGAYALLTHEPALASALADLDDLLVAMPQKFAASRRYVNTFLRLLFYHHVLRRFDLPHRDRARANLLVLWADEAQRFMTASEDGTSDYNCVDVIREACATVVAATQSTTSFLPPLGNDKSKCT